MINMPRIHPCPKCGKWGDRKVKTLNGAKYYCTGCKEDFFIRGNK